MKTKPIKFRTSKFMAWLSKQPKWRKFDYMDCDHCACASFAKEGLGFKNASAGGDDIQLDGWEPIPARIIRALNRVNQEAPYHFTAHQLLKALTK